MAKRLTGHVRKSRSPAHKDAPWVADYNDQFGKRHQPRFATKRAAQEFLVTVLPDVKKGVHTPAYKSPTVAEMGELHLERLTQGEYPIKHGTWKSYHTQLKRHILPAELGGIKLGDIKVAELTTAHLADYRDLLLARCNYSNAKSTWSLLNRILEYAIQKQKLHQNLLRLVDPITRDPRHVRKLRVGVDLPTNEEARAILAYVEANERPRWRAQFAMFLMAGLRNGEIRGLTWNDIELEKGVIRVTQAADVDNKIGPPKSYAGQREIRMSDYLVAALREWRQVCPHLKGSSSFGTTFEKAQEIGRYLLYYPAATNRLIAKVLKVDIRAVTRIRKVMRLPPPDIAHFKVMPPIPPDVVAPDLSYHENRARWGTSAAKAREIARLLTAHPDLTNKHIARCFGVNLTAMAKIRKAMGLPPARYSPVRNYHRYLTPPPPEVVAPLLHPRDGEEWLVFPSHHGRVQFYEVLHQKLKEIQVAAGVVDAEGKAKYSKTHRFRHYFATSMLQTGMPIKRVQTMLGHSRATLTVDTYGHYIPDEASDQAWIDQAAMKLLPPVDPSYLQPKTPNLQLVSDKSLKLGRKK